MKPNELFKPSTSRSYIFSLAPIEPFTTNPIVREMAGISGAQLVYRPKINPFHLLKAFEWQKYQKIQNLENLKTPWNEPIYDGIQLLARPDDPIKNAVREVSQQKNEIGIQFIDLNFSCPGYKVKPQNRGGELMKYPEKIREVVEKVFKFTNLPISVKIRRGYTIKDNAAEVLKILKDFDLAWITINRAPVIRSNVDWESLKKDIVPFEEAHKIIDGKFPIIANGDLDNIERIRMLQEANLCQGIMIGRSALGNYGIFYHLMSELRNKTGFESNNPNKSLLDFYDLRSIKTDGNLTNELRHYFSTLFSVIHKYTSGDSARYCTIAQLKHVFFHIIKQYFECQNKQLPKGYGFTNFMKKEFQEESLIQALMAVFPLISKNEWASWFQNIN